MAFKKPKKIITAHAKAEKTASKRGHQIKKSTTEEGASSDISLLEYSQNAMKHYGSYVIENRALADIRDGLKPVHRRILWAMYKLGLKPSGGYKKSARTVGDVIGMYHPHGDSAVYQAMVGMAGVRPKGKKTGWLRKNTNEPTIEGRGNFGDHVDGAAAQRYTEAKISTYGENFLLDPDYLAVSDMVPNFSDDAVEPVILPAKIPNLLVNGSEGIAVGVASNIPSFNLEAVRKCASLAIQGKLTEKTAMKYLSGQFSFAYGGESVDEEGLADMISEGAGAIVLSPSYREEGDAFIITSVCPRFNINKAREQILAVKNTVSVKNETGDEGIKIVCRSTKGLTGSMRNAWIKKIQEIIQVKITYRMAATVRHTDGTVSFKTTSILDIFKSWADWRVEIEKKVIKYKMGNLRKELNRLQTLLIAIDHIDFIIKTIRTKGKGEVEHEGVTMPWAKAELMKKMDLTLPQVEIIFEMKLRSLEALEEGKMKAKVKAIKADMAVLKADYENPAPRILNDLAELKV